MKALVLSGGSGTRLRPFTHTTPKQLVPVANKPVLYYVLEDIARAGITEVGIVVGETADEIRKAVGDGERFGLRVTYLPQEKPLGLAHAVLIARDYLGDEDFVMYLGDNFVVGGIADLVGRFRHQRPDVQIMLTRVSDPSCFGVAEIGPDGRVISLQEKPQFPRSDMAVVGIYFFTPVVHKAVRAISPSARGELEITDALQWLLEGPYDVRSTTISGYWKDTGNPADMLEMNRLVLDGMEQGTEGDTDASSELVGRVRIEAGARIRESRIVGPVVIGTGTLVQNSYVGPYTSIAENCRIVDSEIEFSIVLGNSRLSGTRRVQRSLIGRNVTVTPAPRVPACARLILGDDSRVEFTS
ncbi:glucose-1-phosphate thymidylyltransferase [Streptomyces sp. CA-278952]|uniref:glucose-1-phosphate thymidylyltransferase n=1 Tax=unclassified Streptomyces TaxID=2593676 RepID=UPI0023683E51|nr:glucose-1-phosphate thymidylyltransferase [Streptomyces sp. CA-278952]WDG28507.1 glucose-1-phosphate thymidylyltransferase [Streptomyces sp. CA-278952]